MKLYFRNVKLSKTNKERLDLINSIIQEYQEQWYTLTLRQLYYQLVSRDVIPNKSSEYSKLSTLLKEGRMWGVVDWSAIEDRVRRPQRPYYVNGIAHAIEDSIDQYMLDRMEWQDTYIEVWVEKDALKPQTLNQILIDNIENYIDVKKYQEILDQENKDKITLMELRDKMFD